MRISRNDGQRSVHPQVGPRLSTTAAELVKWCAGGAHGPPQVGRWVSIVIEWRVGGNHRQ